MALIPTNSTPAAVDVDTFREFAGAPIKLVRGDAGGEIIITLKNSNVAAEGVTLDPNDSSTWAPIDLTDATVVLKLREENSAEVKEVITMGRQAPVTSGVVFLVWTDTALDTAGAFTGEVEIRYTSGQVLTIYKELRFQIREDY